jgi:AcrR family transcriptional regulator
MKSTKDEIYWRIFDSVLRLEVQKGHLKWKVADLSRAAKVNRTLIYYYFGDSKAEIIRNATISVAEVFFGNEASQLQQLIDGDIAGVVHESRRLALKSPHVVDFYLTWRRQNSEITDELARVENRYFEKLKKIFPALELDSLKAIYATFFGLVVNPAITPKAIDIACGHIREQFQKK